MNMYINDCWFMPNAKRTGTLIKSIRKNNGLSIEQFASDLVDDNDNPIDIKTIYSWEHGDSLPSLVNLEKINKKYNVSFEELLLPNQNFIELNTSPIVSLENGYDCYRKELFGDFVCDGFDEYDYPKPFKKFIFSEKNFNSHFSNIANFEYILQKALFSYWNVENYEKMLLDLGFVGEFIDEYGFSSFVKKIEKEYGNAPKQNLTEELRNEILFEFYSKCKVFDCSDILFKLLMANNFYYQIGILIVLPPLKREYVYNALLASNVLDMKVLIEKLELLGCRKYNFLNSMSFDLDDNYENVFKDSRKRMIQVGIFEKCIKVIDERMKTLSYSDYLLERSK